MIQQVVFLVRQLRHIVAFKVTVRVMVITLMLLGVWVATKKLDFPSGVSVNDKLIHILVFFGFAFLMDLASARKPFWLWKGLPLLVYGVGIEVLQYFTPFRSFSVMDMVADCGGILVYFLLKLFILSIVKRNGKIIKTI